MTEPRVITPERMSELLGGDAVITAAALRKKAQRKQIPSWRPGRKIGFLYPEHLDWLLEHFACEPESERQESAEPARSARRRPVAVGEAPVSVLHPKTPDPSRARPRGARGRPKT